MSHLNILFMNLFIHPKLYGQTAGVFRSHLPTVTFLAILTVLCAPGQADTQAAANSPPDVSRSAAPLEAKLPTDIYPASAYTFPVGGSEGLQQALDVHRIVRLLPFNYGPGPVTLHSGQELYGLPGTKLGEIVVEPGTTGALVSMVRTNVLFPASDTMTRGNTILRTYASIIVRGATLVDNLFVDARNVDMDVSTGGYLRNNRFIRAPGQMQGSEMLKFHANPDRPSTGNVFLWVNPCTNKGPATDIAGVPDLTIAVVNAEMWSALMKAPTPLFVTGPMQRLNLFAVHGGRYDKDLDFRKASGLIDSAAKEARVYGLICGYRGQPPDTLPPKIVLRDGNERSLFADCLHYSYSLPATNRLSVRAFVQPEGTVGLGPGVKPAEIPPIAVEPAGADQTQQTTLKDMILQTGREMHPWPRPSFDPPPTPPGDDWAKDVAAAPDSTQMLQSRIDKEGIVVLPAGKYHISAPLRINIDKGLIGAGMSQTVIIAKDPGMSMFVYDPQVIIPGVRRGVTLANLTLQGGGVGVHLRGDDIVHGPMSYTYLTHITFRNMSVAGVFVDMTGAGDYSFDNNHISFCNFVDCASGLKQATPPQARWGFIDKLVTYRCQFLRCGLGVDFPANHVDDTNAFIECLFQGNTTGAARLVNNTLSSFDNCDFIDNAGAPVVASNLLSYFISCRFEGGSGTQSYLPSQSCAEGCVFTPGTSTRAVIVKKPVRNLFYNCRAEMPTGPLNDALLLNNQFADRPDLSQVAVDVQGGKPSVLVPGTPQPGPQILVTGD